MDTLLNMFINPVKAFNQLKTEEKFPVTALIVLLTLVLINLILFVPISMKTSELVIYSTPMTESQIDMAMQVTYKFRYLTVIGGFVMYIIILFINALILFVIALLFKTGLNYLKALRLIILCFIVLAIGDLVNTALLYFRGIDTIESAYDIMLTGANLFTSVENAGVAMYLFLSYINPFQTGFVVLLIIGFKVFTDSVWSKSAIVCLIYWLIVTLFPVLTTYFSQMLMANKGLI